MLSRLVSTLCLALNCTLALAAPSALIFHAPYDGSIDGTDPKGAVAPVETTGKVEYRLGKFGQALVCGGDGAEVKYPIAGHVRPSQGTVSLWAQGVDWPADEQAFHVLFETQGPGWLVLYKFYTGGWLFLSGLDNQHFGSAWADQFSVKNGEWHHYAGVWSRDKLALYVDGKLLKDTPLPALPQELLGWFRIGDNGWMKTHTSHTLVDEARIYRYALPPEQIALDAQGQPVDYRPPISIAVDPHPARQEWKVSVDASGYTDDPQATAVLSIASGGKTWVTSKPVPVRDGVASATLGISKIPAGVQTVKATVTEPSGKEAGRAELAFTKPDKAPWAGNQIGMHDRVLRPFTAMTLNGCNAPKIEAGDSKVGCWGRGYTLNGVFPSQIQSQGQKLLARPISLRAQTTAGPVAWKAGTGKITSFSDTRVKQEASADSPQASLTTKTTAEYDGFVWTELTLTPKAATELTDLTLQIPLDPAVARYLHHVRGYWGEDDAGLLPAAGFAGVGFHPYMWLGDDDRGLAWFADSPQGWSIAPGKATVEAKREGDVVMLQVHIVNQPTKLEAPLKISFGLQATPVKPRPADARSWRLGNLGAEGYMKDASKGTIQVLWPNGNLQYYGWPVPKDPVAFRKTVQDLHGKGARVIPYVNLNFMANGAKEWEYYSSDFRDPARSFTTGDVAQMGSALIGACPTVPAWRDLIAWKLAKFVEEYDVDGIYVDCWNPNACMIEDHGCGWRDAQGNLQGRYSILGSREIVRRVQELLQDRVKNPHIIIHMSTTVCIPMLSFADSMLDGEQYQATTKDPRDDYLAIVPLDKWRAENTGLQWGVVPFFLPELAGENRAKDYPTHRLMGLMLAHDCSPWPIWSNSQVIFDAWTAGDKFGLQTAQFLPYWKPNGVKVGGTEAVVSVYKQPGKALLVVLNTAQSEQAVQVTVDPAALGLKAGFGAARAADGQKLPVEAQTVTVKVPARDFQMVVVE